MYNIYIYVCMYKYSPDSTKDINASQLFEHWFHYFMDCFLKQIKNMIDFFSVYKWGFGDHTFWYYLFWEKILSRIDCE